jgi:hypothetical protein
MAKKRFRYSFNAAGDKELFRAVEDTAKTEGKRTTDLIREILREVLAPQIEALRHVPPRSRKPKSRSSPEDKD